MIPLEINDEDITYAENHFGLSFSEEQKFVIKCLESVDIHACPGSGKTTTLAAKLLILLKKIPESYNEGICVITHTNVAVEAIKEKIGKQAIRLFSYPNHFGTIQSFVDKYLTLPAYRNHYRRSPCQIDDSTYHEILAKQNLSNSTRFYFSRNNTKINDLVFNLKSFVISKGILIEAPFVGVNTLTYNTIKTIKHNILELGYMKFDESYSMGMRWLKKQPQLCNYFSFRFPYVFIDEMQDMAPYQEELLSIVLVNCPVVQRIGDNNQAIFSNSSQANSQPTWNPANTLSIQGSCRFSEAIATRVKNVCVTPAKLNGRDDLPQIPPKVIVYNNNTIEYVKSRFAQLILRNNLQNYGSNIFKAVGFRKSDSKLNIGSYYREYHHSETHNKGSLPNLSLYLRFKINESSSTSVASIKNILLSVLCKILRLKQKKHPINNRDYTSYSLWKYLKNYQSECFNNLCKELLIWPLNVKIDELLPKVRIWITTIFLPSFEIKLDVELNSFINSTDPYPADLVLSDTSINIYRYRENGKEVAVEFNTIHGVKGETHCATLYLETYTRCYDLEKLIPFFLGNTSDIARSKEEKRLRPGYVAITRPSHMLCLAIHADRFPVNYAEGMKEAGWEIIRL